MPKRRSPHWFVGLLVALLALPALGPLPAHAAGAALPAGPYWFNWFDKASPGMTNDNIHIVNPSAGTAHVTLKLGGQPDQTGAIDPGKEMYFTYPFGTIGGPLEVLSEQILVVSQRVVYFGSLNEIPAAASSAAGTSFWFPWYDRASPGMWNDNIHVLYPAAAGAPAANVVVTVPGAVPGRVSLNPGEEKYLAFGFGVVLGGPVHVTSDQPVLVSQRVQYNQSFNETPGTPDAQFSNTVVFNWYDHASPGFAADDVHVVNGGAATAHISVALLGYATQSLTLGPAQEGYVRWSGIGGPVVVSADQPVMATQRVNYYGAFKEYVGQNPSAASTDLWFNWYDNASPCFLQNNIHLYGAGPSASDGTVTMTDEWGALKQLSFHVAAYAEGIFSFASGTIGGPVHIQVTSGSPVLPELRTVICPPPPPPPPPPPTPKPIRLRVPSIGIWANTEEVGMVAGGSMGTPSNIWDVGWYDQMPRPGDGGDAVMTGHLDWYYGQLAVFWDLQNVPIGAYAYVDREDGSTVRFVVDSKSWWPYNDPPTWLFSTVGNPQLSLVTCAGVWDGNMYTQRMVVHTHAG